MGLSAWFNLFAGIAFLILYSISPDRIILSAAFLWMALGTFFILENYQEVEKGDD